MARLFGLIGNRPDLAARVLAFEADALRARSKGAPLGWGLGFYQGGEVLMRRRPIDDRAGDSTSRKLAPTCAPTVVVGHVRSATVGALRTENTHPFRYRQWLFAQTGTSPSSTPSAIASSRASPSSSAAESAATPTPRSSSTCSSRSCTTRGG